MRKVKTFKIYQFFMIKENAHVLGDEFLQHYTLRTWKVWSLSFWMLYLKFSWDNFSWFYRFKRTHIKKIIYIWFGTDNSIFQMCLVDQIRKYGDSSLIWFWMQLMIQDFTTPNFLKSNNKHFREFNPFWELFIKQVYQ